MKEDFPYLVDTQGRQTLEEPALSFLRFAFLAILAGCAVFIGSIFVLVPDQAPRALGPAAMSLVALAAWTLYARGQMRACVYVLSGGIWTAVTVIANFTGGVFGMAIIVYPLIIFMLGWMISIRAAVIAATLSIAATLYFALAAYWGTLPAPPPTPPIMRWFVQSAVFVYSVYLFIAFARSYQNRMRQLQALGDDLHRAQAIAHVGSWVYDLDTDTMHLSAETSRIFGLPGGVTGSHDSYLARVHPEDRKRVDAAWQTALARCIPFDNEHRILVGDEVRWIRQLAEFIRNADGVTERCVGTTQDITARKRADEALRASEERFRALLQDVPNVAVQGYLLDGTTSYWNRASEALYGYGANEALGRSLLDLIIPPEMRDGVRAAIAQMADTGVPMPASELSLLRKDGSRVPVYSSHTLVHIPGRATELFCIDIDLTAQKRHESELLATRNHLDATLNAVPDLMFEMDLDGRFHDFHSPRADLLFMPPERFLGKNVAELMPSAVAEACMTALREARDTGGSLGTQYELALPQGRFWFELSVARKSVEPGMGARFIVLARDITERKQAELMRARIEEQMRESQKMEALGTLAGGIAHDFNNIVAAILGNAELAHQDVGPSHPARESLAEIRKASLRAKELVKQILAFSRRQLIERKITSLVPAIEESVHLLRATLPAGIELRVHCEHDAPMALVDTTQIEQVMLNLCNNACQALQAQRGSGVIEITLAMHLVAGAPYRGPERRVKGERLALKPGRYACLSVRDTGPGIDDATRSRMFEPFFTTKPAGQGTGLGLAVVHGIVLAHDASIAVQTRIGAGTTIRIYFPAATASAEPAAKSLRKQADPMESGAPGAPQTGKHVLYLDDDEAIVFLMTRLLKRQGYRVSGYTEAHVALDAIRADPHQYDLVVTDYSMPGMSGLEVARELKRIRAALPVALASGYITDELRAAAPAAGVRELIYKPDTASDFCLAVARLVGSLPH